MHELIVKPMRRRLKMCASVMAFVLVVACGSTILAVEPVQDTPYAELTPKYFDVHYSDFEDDVAPAIEPWKTIVLDPDYRGSWIVAGDLNGDRRREIVCARSVGEGSARFTSAVAAHDLDGNVLWKWGDPSVGTGLTSFDIACQIHDCDGDGDNEVVLASNQALVILDGQTGHEVRRIATPPHVSDSIIFCDLQGRGFPSDWIVKDRYERLCAYGHDGNRLWDCRLPGGYLTAHQPLPVDFEGDGRDEIIAGFAALSHDGKLRWVLDDAVPFARGADLSGGHLDCARVLRESTLPGEMRIVLTFCSSNRIAVVDERGKFLWRVAGAHFESADVGNLIAQEPGRQILVDIDHQPWGQSPLVIFSEQGELLGRFMLEAARHHLMVDWTGDGVDSIVVAAAACMFNGRGERTARFAMPTPAGERPVDRRQLLCQKADMNGDGAADLLFSDNPGTRVYVYRNQLGRRTPPTRSMGSDNFTYY